MPLYEYKCAKCGGVFEVIQKFVDAPLTSHESCGGAVERLISSSALQFKGSGWYVNDYARNGGSKDKAKSGGDSGAAKEGSAPAAETAAKPATPPAPSAK
jgi:putative FmdB family regulatory protein